MKRKYKRLWLVPLILAATVTGWGLTHSYPPQIKLSSAGETHVKELLKGMKTHCVGRYLIDLPASFTLLTGKEPLEKNKWVADINWPERSYKTYITSKRMYYPAFEQLLKRREQELLATRTHNPANMPFLKKVWPLPGGMKGIIFERNLSRGVNDSVRKLEAYLYSEGVAIKLQKESIDYSSSRYEKVHKALGRVINDIPGDIEKLNNLLSRIRGREADEIPREAGSCIASAFIAADKKGSEQEDITILFSSEALPGFDIEVSTNNFLRSESRLLDRAGEISKTLAGVNAKIASKGHREITPLKAEEMLMTGPKPGSDYPVYIFDLYVNETQASNKTPWLNVVLSNEGNAIIPSTDYSQEELMAFWQAITQTVRMRPGSY